MLLQIPIIIHITANHYHIMPMNCTKILGLTDTTEITTTGTKSGYIDMGDKIWIYRYG